MASVADQMNLTPEARFVMDSILYEKEKLQEYNNRTLIQSFTDFIAMKIHTVKRRSESKLCHPTDGRHDVMFLPSGTDGFCLCFIHPDRPSVCLSVCLSRTTSHSSNSLRIWGIGLKFSVVMHSTMKQIAVQNSRAWLIFVHFTELFAFHQCRGAVGVVILWMSWFVYVSVIH